MISPHVCVVHRGRWGTVDTFLYFQPLLLYFKSKQAQNLSYSCNGTSIITWRNDAIVTTNKYRS